MPFSSVRAHCENWLACRKREISEATFQSYQVAVERLFKYLGDDAEKDLTYIPKARIAGFRDFLLTRYRTRSSNQYLKIVRMIFRAARIDGYLWQDPRRRNQVG